MAISRDEYMGLVPVTMSDEDAVAAFVARYHKQPAEVKRTPTCILVGPTPKAAYNPPDWLTGKDIAELAAAEAGLMRMKGRRVA